MSKGLVRIQAALRALAKFIKLGWRVVTEVHSITWLIIEIFGVTLPPIAFMIWAYFRGLLSYRRKLETARRGKATYRGGA